MVIWVRDDSLKDGALGGNGAKCPGNKEEKCV